MQGHSKSPSSDSSESGSNSISFLRHLVENIAHASWAASNDGIIVDANLLWANYVGERPGERGSRSIHDAVHPDDLTDHLQAWNQAVAGKTAYEAHLRLRRHDGDYRVHHVRAVPVAVPVAVPDQQAFTWIAICTKTEQRLQASQQNLTSVINTAQVAIAHCDRERRFRFVNRAYAERFGLNPEDFAGKNIDEMLGPEAFEMVSSAIEQVLEGFEVELEVETNLPSLGRRCMHARYTPCIDATVEQSGQVQSFVAVVSDITEQKRTELELRRSEERYRAIVENQTEMVCRFRTNGTILFTNAAYARSRGTTADSLIGKNFWEFVAASDRTSVQDMLDQLSPSAPEVRIENRFEAVDGTRWTLWTNCGLAFDTDGKATEVQSTGIDISDRKRVEQALRESEERYRTLFNSIDEGFCVLEILFDDSGRGCDHRFVEVNPAFERQTGLVDATGKTALQLVPDLEPQWPERYGRIALSGEAERFIDHSPAMGRWFEVDAFPIGDPDQRRVALLFTNITARKKTELALQEADRRKDEFLATLAHELRNPLAPIRSGLEVLKLHNNDSAETRQVRDMMQRQTEQLVRLIDDLLDLSRITRGRIELRRQFVKLNDVLQNAADACQPAIEEAGHELTIKCPGHSVTVHADPHRLTQVVSNLLNNAAKYTEKGGKIWLSAETKAERLLITVRDTGIGIPIEMQRQVFEMFTQVKTRQADSGLGIGLTLVKSLIELHGGQIEVDSEGVGKGTTIRLQLPIVTQAESTTAKPVDFAPVDLSGLNVLVVDDTRAGVFMLRKILESHGCRVHEAYDGLAAVEAAQEFKPDAVIMDIGMPRMDGYEAAREIRAQPWGQPMLLIALTGWGQQVDRLRTQEAGFNHHLVKPPDPSQLREILASLKLSSEALES